MRPILVMATLPLLILGQALTATPAAAGAATELRCPPSLTVQAQPEAPGGWSPYPAKDLHSLAGATLVEGDRAARMAESAAPAPLPADRELRRARALIQAWEFPGPRREPVFLLCRYRNTQAALAIDLPRDTRRCTLTLETDLRGTPVEEPKTAPQMACR